MADYVVKNIQLGKNPDGSSFLMRFTFVEGGILEVPMPRPIAKALLQSLQAGLGSKTEHTQSVFGKTLKPCAVLAEAKEGGAVLLTLQIENKGDIEALPIELSPSHVETLFSTAVGVINTKN